MTKRSKLSIFEDARTGRIIWAKSYKEARKIFGMTKRQTQNYMNCVNHEYRAFADE